MPGHLCELLPDPAMPTWWTTAMFLIWPRSYFESSVICTSYGPSSSCVVFSDWLDCWSGSSEEIAEWHQRVTWLDRLCLHQWLGSTVSSLHYTHSSVLDQELWEQPDDCIFSYLKIHLICRSSVLHFGAWIICFLVPSSTFPFCFFSSHSHNWWVSVPLASLSRSLIWCEIFTK